MNEDVFSINNFNIIEDGDNYYLFRALNLDDQREIGEGINSNNGEIQKVITNKQRYPENDRYANETEISLKEIWDTSPLFEDLRDFRRYEGKCGVCKYLKVCGGCRARAYAVTGSYLSEEPFCRSLPSRDRFRACARTFCRGSAPA